VRLSGGIGQPLSLLLKADPLVSQLSLYDIRGAPGVAADVSHIDTGSEVSDSEWRYWMHIKRLPPQVVGYPADGLAHALKGSKVVIIPAGVPRKPGMTRDDLFNTNASIVRDLAQSISEHAPDAHVLIISSTSLRHP
jgi:malate dehydrogenase